MIALAAGTLISLAALAYVLHPLVVAMRSADASRPGLDVHGFQSSQGEADGRQGRDDADQR